MKRFLKLALPVILCVAFYSATAFAAPHHVSQAVGHDGTWWQSKSPIFREGFISGYRSGFARAKPSGRSDIASIKPDQMIDGLNTFYKDFRNMNVQVEDTMDYVKDELNGKSDADLATELQTLRKNAADAQAAAQDAKGDQ